MCHREHNAEKVKKVTLNILLCVEQEKVTSIAKRDT